MKKIFLYLMLIGANWAINAQTKIEIVNHTKHRLSVQAEGARGTDTMVKYTSAINSKSGNNPGRLPFEMNVDMKMAVGIKIKQGKNTRISFLIYQQGPRVNQNELIKNLNLSGAEDYTGSYPVPANIGGVTTINIYETPDNKFYTDQR